MSRLEALVAESRRSVGETMLVKSHGHGHRRKKATPRGSVLEGYSVLRHMLEAGLPHESDVASIGGL